MVEELCTSGCTQGSEAVPSVRRLYPAGTGEAKALLCTRVLMPSAWQADACVMETGDVGASGLYGQLQGLMLVDAVLVLVLVLLDFPLGLRAEYGTCTCPALSTTRPPSSVRMTGNVVTTDPSFMPVGLSEFPLARPCRQGSTNVALTSDTAINIH